ncbi:MAG: hypothetical protein AAFU85_29105 [Planctomycetota bacterium]
MKTKPVFPVLVFFLLVVVTYFVGFKLGEDQAHQRIADAWNGFFGQRSEAAEKAALKNDIQDSFGQDPFGPSTNTDPFTERVAPFSGDGDSAERLETGSTE